MEKELSYLWWQEKRRHYLKDIAKEVSIFLFLFALAVFGVFVITQRLRSAIDRKTENYITDVSIQNAARIEEKLQELELNLILTKSTILKMNDQEVEQLLQEAASLLEYDELHLLYDRDAIGVQVLDGQQIRVGIELDEERVLAGTLSQESIQSIIRSQSFDGQGLICIVDKEGKVIISPTVLDYFLQLDQIFQEKLDQRIVEEIHQMEENMLNGQRGVIQFTAKDNTDLVMSYIPLNDQNWVLLTLVPADLVTREVDQYAFWNYLMLTFLLGLSALFLGLVFFRSVEYRQRLSKSAFTDTLTGALNELGFRDRCRELLDKDPTLKTILFLNLRNFKLVNENFQSIIGDQILKIVMQSLNDECHENEVAGRIEADHFALLLESADNLSERIQRRIELIRKELRQHEILYNITFHAGIYQVRTPQQEVQLMLGRAKNACMLAGYQGKTICFYDQKMIDQLKREQELSDAFEEALANGQFYTVLQPKVDPQDEKVAGAEALVRWKHPLWGVIPPDQFIPLFEKNGCITELDFAIFEQVCVILENWKKNGIPLIPISVNLSRQHFQSFEVLDRLMSILEKYDVQTKWIELEMTESIFFDAPSIQRVKEMIGRMHELGFRCSLDDFGSGYSSLGLLKEFAIDAIKLDHVFFSSEDERSRQIVEGIVHLASTLNATVVAEGVEKRSQVEFLRSLHCDLIQGYYYSKPILPQEFDQWADLQGRKQTA